jgi:hypothetical protein
MLRLFEGVAAAVSVVLFLSWLLFCRGWFSVVLLFSSWLIATPTSLPFDHSPFATRYSPFAAVLPVANRHLLPFPSCCFFVVANSHSSNLPVANRQSLIASRQSLPFNSPVAIRYSLPFSLVGQFAG